MSEESRSFAASNRAADFVATSRTIDAHVYAGKIGWPEDQMFADYCSRAVETGITGMGLSVANQNDDFEAALKTRKNLQLGCYK